MIMSYRITIFLLLFTLPFAHAGASVRRAVRPAGSGYNHLSIDALLLSSSRPLAQDSEGQPLPSGLDDFRLRTRSGQEVPYILLPPPSRKPSWMEAIPVIIPVTRRSSGFEADFGSVLKLDALELEGLPSPFLKHVRLEGSGDRIHWTTLVSDGTLLDLPAENHKQLRLDFPPGPYRFLHLVWDDSGGGRQPLPSRVKARLAPQNPEPPPTLFVVPFTRMPAPHGKSRFRLSLPAPGLPVRALRLETEENALHREARVTMSRLDNSQMVVDSLARGLLLKEPDHPEALRIPVSPPSRQTIDLTVEDGDNPPLGLRQVWVELPPLPGIVFFAPDGEPLEATFGTPSLAAPHYDLEASRDKLSSLRIPEARWGEVLPAPSSAPPRQKSPQEPIASGAILSSQNFLFRRSVSVAPKGLALLPLDPHVLAQCHYGFNLRLLGPDSRQIPYLLEQSLDPLVLDLGKPVPEANAPARVSRYHIHLPEAELPDATLILSTPTPTFSRTLTLRALHPDPPNAQPIASAEWSRTEEDSVAELRLALPWKAPGDLLLEVEEGDNAPLPLNTPRLEVPAYRLRFFHPGGTQLTLLYGNSDHKLPSYDISLLASELQDQPATAVSLGPVQDNPDRGPVGAAGSLFWIGIVVAATVLFGLLIRLLLKGEPSDSSGQS